jgi:Ni/Co efflux regulator RcnB
MKRLLAALLAALAAACVASAQTDAAAARTQADGDLCHVYVVDVLKARKAQDEYRDTGDPERDSRALLAAQVVFPEFRTTRGEEELTKKTYRFPRSRLFITASVFYTDEMMASAAGVDSMLLSLTLSRRALRTEGDIFDAENNAEAELTDATADTVRVKQYVRVGGRRYLLGMECSRKPPRVEDAP